MLLFILLIKLLLATFIISAEPFDKNKFCPIEFFGGSKPNKSFVILLPFPFPFVVSLSQALGSKSLSESEFNNKPSNFVPTLGFNASNVLFIWFWIFLGGTVGAKCFGDVSINNWSSLWLLERTSVPVIKSKIKF